MIAILILDARKDERIELFDDLSLQFLIVFDFVQGLLNNSAPISMSRKTINLTLYVINNYLFLVGLAWELEEKSTFV